VAFQGAVRARGVAPVGHWRRAFLSPDRTMLLAQWSAECEVPRAFFVPAAGGTPHVVSGERDWTKAPNSVALGWSSDGRAKVELLQQACGIGAHRPGVYLIDPSSGRAEFVRGLLRRKGRARMRRGGRLVR
jgi:hypothetical protein